ncbi:MAG TPA: hypothetical protein VM869_16330 [Enhygromyxa sp.]|nr:hypothetical protein [Enhygromyxa sp.]
MSRLSQLVLVGLSLTLGACRANEEQCRDLARHIVEIADAEGKGRTAGTAVALEGDCKAVRPTKRLVDCMMAAQSLAAIDEC